MLQEADSGSVEEIEDFSEQKPPVTLKEAQAAGDIVARFVQQETAVFSAERLFTYERQINGELKKMIISKFIGKKQQKITKFF